MHLRGINYDTGVNYQAGNMSRMVWDSASVKRDMHVIAKELHCNAITVFGTDTNRISECAEYAIEQGLEVWLQPRLIDGSPVEVLSHMMELAKIAEGLRLKHENIVFNLGCELSLFMKGILPGKTYQTRLISLMIFWPVIKWFNRKLNRFLREACQMVRKYFNGTITYSSAIWENVDWSVFDYVGVDYYRDKRNEATYTKGLRKFNRYGKPVVITEFGCSTFRGAAKKGGAGFLIIDWKKTPPEVKKGYVRDEQEQANYLQQLIRIYRSEDVLGAFVYAFSEPSNPHTSDPGRDLDMASYGIVKVKQDIDPQSKLIKEQWEPKEAFYKLAKLYSE